MSNGSEGEPEFFGNDDWTDTTTTTPHTVEAYEADRFRYLAARDAATRQKRYEDARYWASKAADAQRAASRLARRLRTS